MSVKPRVYLEPTVISNLTAAPSRDIVQAAHQQITREWRERRKDFDLFVSQAVITEAGRGDSGAAARLATLEDVGVLEAGGHGERQQAGRGSSSSTHFRPRLPSMPCTSPSR